MSIQPIKPPELIQNRDNARVNPIRSLGNDKEKESIFITPEGNKAPKTQAFAAYKEKIDKQNNLVIRHEEAHLAFAGRQASGSPVYESTVDKYGNKIITGGHQMIIVPSKVDKTAPFSLIRKTKEDAELVFRGATAPASFDQLSAADESIAEQAKQIESSAKTAENERVSLEPKGVKPEEDLRGLLPAHLTGDINSRKSQNGKEGNKKQGEKINFVA